MKKNETEYAEHSVRKVPSAGVLLILTLGFLVLSTATYFLWRLAWFIGALAALGFGALFVYFGFIRTKIEYEYTISNGIWRFVRTQGGRDRQTVIEVSVSNVYSLEPYSKEAVKGKKGHIYDFRRTIGRGENIYVAIAETEKENAVIIFQGTDRALKILKSSIEE